MSVDSLSVISNDSTSTKANGYTQNSSDQHSRFINLKDIKSAYKSHRAMDDQI